MSTKGNAIDHNVIIPLKSTTITISNTDTTASATGVTRTVTGAGEWLDVSGWTDKVISGNITDAGTPPGYNILLQISDQHNYELNNKTAALNTDYIVASAYTAGQTGKGAFRVDGADCEDLQRPIRSLRPVFKITSATLATASTTGTASTVVPTTDKLAITKLAVEGVS